MKNHFSLLLIVLSFFAFSCGSTHKLPEVQSLPAGQSWSGVWYSKQYQHMYLRQTGNEVRGIYSQKDGGTLEGTANGNLLEFNWIDPGNKSEARRSLRGKGYLSMKRDGDIITLTGEWGYDDQYHGGGVWEAEFVRATDSDDPRNLDELINND